MAEQVPSVGRVVHFVNGDKHVPAIITDPNFEVKESDKPTWIGQALTVFPVNEPPFTVVADYDSAGSAATWHWPEFIPPKG